jgi:hypothetical protein
MQSNSSVLALSAILALVGCNKTPSASEATASATATAAAPSTAATPSSSAATAAAVAAPFTGLDTCLVGTWKGKGFSLKTDQVSAEGGANLALKIAASGESVVDFGAMSPVNGKGAGASFDFQYSGKASGTLTTPTRGTIASSKSDYSGLKVTTNVQIPGAGKIALFKNKPVSELAQMAAAVAGGKAPAAGAPPGIDSSPVFSNSRYTCEGDTLSLSGDKLAAEWVFTRVSH